MTGPATNEIVFTIPMVLSGVWTAVTGDLFLPSAFGAVSAVLFRMARTGGDGYLLKDVLATLFMSFGVGMIAGPYVASHMPDGDGVIGVGALISSFLGTALLASLNRIDWDLGAWIKIVAHNIATKKK